MFNLGKSPPRRWVGLLATLMTLGGMPGAASSVSRWPAEGHARDVVSEYDGRLVGGVRYVPAMVGQGFYFDGENDAVSVPDAETLRLTKSLTISGWVRVDSYPPAEQDYGFVVFRGDDRPGLDPYFLGVRADGTLVFGITGETDTAELRTRIPSGRFIRVTASLDDHTGLMRLMFDDRIVAQSVTAVRPFHDLAPGAHPGVGIGNHASQPDSQYNMPFHGVLDEISISSQTTLAPSSVTLQKEGRDHYLGTVTLATPAPAGGALVALGASDLEIAVPPGVTVSPGATSANFVVSAPDASKSATITAAYNGFSKSVKLSEATK